LYLNPPDNALVLSVDEKTQIQALDRTQPKLQLKPGQIERRTHPRLQEARHDQFIRGSEYPERRSGWAHHTTPPRQRVSRFSATN
tara:strand:- start:3396 stop:3650 length:255 start_codon:yes stop_codon:yes gene_type:complete